MKIHKKTAIFILFTCFVLYGLNHYIFERRFYFNELLALVGMLTFLKKGFTKQGKLKFLRSSPIYQIVIYLLMLCSFHAFISIFTCTNTYFYLRNSVIFYSIFTFFFGFYTFHYWQTYVAKIRFWLISYITYALIRPAHYLLDRFSAAVFFPFLFKKYHFYSISLVLILNVVYAIRYSSLTVVLITLILLAILLFKNYAQLQLAFFAGFFVFLLFFVSLIPSLRLYKTDKYRLFGDVHRVYADNVFLQLDYNSSWRTILWYRVTVEKFPQNLVGIGFGTPLLEYKKGLDTADSDYNDEHDAHVIGVHNTYITLFVRLGLLYVLFTLLIYHYVFKEFYGFRYFYYKNQLSWVFWSFFTISIIGLFNLILESPIGASLYWGLLGFVARAIENRKVAWAKISKEIG